jgi:hypothetical protein
VVIDCTPAGNANKEKYLPDLTGPKGVPRPGQRVRLRQAVRARRQRRGAGPGRGPLHPDRLLQHPQHHHADQDAGDEGGNGDFFLERGTFVCMRRANDITQTTATCRRRRSGKHDDGSSAPTTPGTPTISSRRLGRPRPVLERGQAQHPVHALDLVPPDLMPRHARRRDQGARLRDNPRVAVTDKRYANLIFSFGRDHGYYGRILSQTVVVLPTLRCAAAARSTASASPRRTATRCCRRWPPPCG